MPIVDRREFGGRFTVRENSQRLANYRYLEIQLMEMLAGWSHTSPQLAVKATFGYHVYDHAQAAERLGERLAQLRSQRESQEPGSDEFGRLCEQVWNLPDVVARLTAVYRVLEPHLTPTPPTRWPTRQRCACCANWRRWANRTWPGARRCWKPWPRRQMNTGTPWRCRPNWKGCWWNRVG